ncbi:hypothetical protein [Cohnella laeviribosi]|nr:hypothetical protein [Cohnella laeviribosi]
MYGLLRQSRLKVKEMVLVRPDGRGEGDPYLTYKKGLTFTLRQGVR